MYDCKGISFDAIEHYDIQYQGHSLVLRCVFFLRIISHIIQGAAAPK